MLRSPIIAAVVLSAAPALAQEPTDAARTVLIDPDVPTDAIIEPVAERRAVFAR